MNEQGDQSQYKCFELKMGFQMAIEQITGRYNKLRLYV